MTENNHKLIAIWEKTKANGNFKYFDYCEEYALKNSFPVDIYKTETKLNFIRYIEITGPDNYLKLLNLFENKIQSKSDEFIFENNMKPLYLESNDKYNPDSNDKYEPDSNDSDIIIPSMSLDLKKIDYCNHIINLKNYSLDIEQNDSQDNEFMELKKFISDGIKNKIFNLDKYFKYVLRQTYDYSNQIDKSDLDNYILTPRFNTKLESVSIANCIIFGESNIRYGDVENLLTLIRFDIKMYSYSIDNFTISNFSGLNLTPNIDDNSINKMKFCNYQDMLLCAKWLIQIMNNINPSQINHHNYHILVQYCKLNDNPEKLRFNNMLIQEQMRIKEITFEE